MKEKLEKAKMLLIKEFFVFYPLLKEIDIVITDENNYKAYTDGVNIYISKKLYKELEHKELAFILFHELLHIVLNHIERFRILSEKQRTLWNISTDFFINENLFNFKIFDSITHLKFYVISVVSLTKILSDSCEKKFRELIFKKIRSSEDLYQFLKNCFKDKIIFIETIDFGDIKYVIESEEKRMDLKKSKSSKEKVEKIKEISEKIYNRIKGNTFGNLEFLFNIENGTVNWKYILRKYLKESLSKGFSVNLNKKKYYINKKFLNKKIIIYKNEKTKKKIKLFVIIDTSLSISDDELNSFINEVYEILKEYNSEIVLIFHDVKITGIHKLKSKKDVEKIKVLGRGGTSHKEVVEYLLNTSEKDRKLVIFFSDFFSDYEEEDEELLKKKGFDILYVNEDLKVKKNYSEIRPKF